MSGATNTGASEPRVLTAKEEWKNGWGVVASSFIGNGLGFNLFLMSAGLFIIPLQAALDVPRTALMISTVAMLLVSFLSPAVAPYLDKYGPRIAVISGYLILIIAYTLLYFAPLSIYSYYAIGFLFVIAGTVTATMAFCKGISLVFHKGAGIAFGLTMSGVSLVSAVVIPLLSAAIESYGWRAGYGLCGALLALIGVPVLLAGFNPRAEQADRSVSPTKPQGSSEVRGALRTGRFWLLAAAISCGTFCIGGMITHLYPMLVAVGFTAKEAATLLSTYAVSIGAGRILIGILLDRSPPTIVAAISMITTAIGAAILYFVLVGHLPIAYAFLAVFLLGGGQGAEGDFPAFFTLRLFGRNTFARIFSWLNIFAGGSLALGGLFYAVIFDWTGSYLSVVFLTALLWLAGAALILAIRMRPLPA